MATATARTTKTAPATRAAMAAPTKQAKPAAKPDLSKLKLNKSAQGVRDKVAAAVEGIENGHKALLAAVLSATCTREQLSAAIYQAYAGRGSEHRTCQKRASEAARVWDMRKQIKALSSDDMPTNLQGAYKVATNLAKGGKASDKAPSRAPRTPESKAADKKERSAENPVNDVEPIDTAGVKALLLNQLNGLKKRAADDETLSLIAELIDVLD